ncbi:MAG: peptidoglycan editing factor PgeF [Hyphomicrobiales bacterium]|nr:peptidoglycan editing factor PgeF [Hyphomicrobiales bacterium]MBV9111916.1 peptidoglycan editing factor PgeF [Hyphomicrobiales bacterium]MBV9520948.1 peptidoglycan editing factor PgeF [Hyphomicrobiales bacterium]
MMLTSSSLSRLSGIAHAFFTREGGVSEGVYASLNGGLGSGDERGRVLENRKRMAAALGVASESFATLFQVHSPDVMVIEKPWDEGVRPIADALVTRRPRLAIAVSSADCGPLLFADEEARVVGAAHAGWKGALTGVIEATIAAMEGEGAERRRIHAALGPMISRAAYEVGPEFKMRFLEANAENARFFTPSPQEGHAMFDLPAYIAARLEEAGIGSVDDLDRCTYGEEALFFSYRRMTHRGETDYGRHLSAIAIME